MAKKIEPKIVLEREYIIPLRREWSKVPEYKRANKAAKAIREFLVRHMKIYDRDLKKVKIDVLLNNELRFRGMRKPPAKIKVKAKKFDDDIVKAELAEIPQVLKYKIEREEKEKKETEKKKAEEQKRKEELKKAAEAAKKEDESKEGKEEAEAEKKDTIEKEKSTVEDGLKQSKARAKQEKHVTGGKQKQPKIKRMALQK